MLRFSDILSIPADILPSATFERDPTVDYRVHKDILYIMASCHSLRLLEGEPVGDPLDVKMFDFTGWSMEETGRKESTSDIESLDEVPATIVRPLTGMVYDIDSQTLPSTVSCPFQLGHLLTNHDRTFLSSCAS